MQSGAQASRYVYHGQFPIATFPPTNSQENQILMGSVEGRENRSGARLFHFCRQETFSGRLARALATSVTVAKERGSGETGKRRI